MLKNLFIAFILFAATTNVQGQETTDTGRLIIQSSGVLSVTTNGISPVPAFSLGKPVVSAFLSLRNKRISYNPEIAFSLDGVPWFLNSIFRYNLIEKSKFKLRTGLMWGISFSNPVINLNSSIRDITKAERLLLIELIPEYKLSENVALSLTAYKARNFDSGLVNKFSYFSITNRITKISVYKRVYTSLFPQLYYLDIDGSNGFFVSGIFGFGLEELPFFLSVQMNQTITTTISPAPAFEWNISLAYSF